ncbi:MAG TPA: Tad domain-containing protein [Chloroflexota bacterium]|nr:Tad domain-containing protein [Chloroflexota bacterium]
MTLLALLLPALLAFVAMGVDLGQGYLQRRDNQNAADAASVGGEQALLHGALDSAVQSTIKNVLSAGGFKTSGITFLSASSPTPGTDPTKAYVDAEYGSFNSGSSKCTPLSSNQYVGSLSGSPPSGAHCIHVVVTTSDNTFFAKVPIIGVPEVSASALGSAGQISPSYGTNSSGVSATPTPTAAPWGSGEGFTIWGGTRADSTVLAVGSNVLFFADSGWDYGNDVQTSCSPCQYQATQNFKGLADPQCFTVPLPSSCTGPNGAHGNPAKNLAAGTEVQVVVVTSVTHQGSSNTLTPIGLASVDILDSCPATPAYLQSGTNGVCGTIENIDTGQLNSTDPSATPTPTPIIGNSG